VVQALAQHMDVERGMVSFLVLRSRFWLLRAKGFIQTSEPLFDSCGYGWACIWPPRRRMETLGRFQ